MDLRQMIADRRKTVVFLGRRSEEGKTRLFATGFLLRIEGFFHMATAKHVVVDPRTGRFIDGGMLAFFNVKNGGVGWRSIDLIKDTWQIEWVFHQRADVDIAIIPFGLNPDRDDVTVIPDSEFVTADSLVESFDVFFLSYQPGIEPEDRMTPVMRNGTISLINDDGTFYIDGAAFPGNSGSPVFLKPSATRFDQGGIRIGSDPLGGKFVGMIGQYLPYQEEAVSVQTGRTRVVFEENTGLSRVWSVSPLKEILDSEAMKKQIDQARKKSILPPTAQ